MKREFVATVYVVHDNKLLLVFHKKLQKWLPPGGHIDKNETPDEAAIREVKEETGLGIELVGDKQPKMHEIVEPLFRPEVVQLENIGHGNELHQHIDFFYLARPKTHNITISEESEDIRWFSLQDLEKEKVPENIRYTAKLMIKKMNNLNLEINNDNMKQFNFLPKYKNWILGGKKFRTIRYGNKYYKEFKIGDKVAITVGDDPKNAEKIAVAEILELVYKKIKEIKQKDVIGDPEAWPIRSLISGLTEIYLKRIGRKITEEDFVTIVRFGVIACQ